MSEKGAYLAPAPPPYRFHQVSPTPSSSRPVSRPSSPPHGGSLPSPLPARGGSGGVGGGGGASTAGRMAAGGLAQLPRLAHACAALLLRRWKSVLFIALFGTLAAFGMFGAMWTEWREMTYYR
jgi:hypothetical protein